MSACLALLAGPAAGWGLVDILILIVIIAACVALVYAALQQFGIAIPPAVTRIFWIVVIAVLVILAIKFVASL